jgi:nitrate/nitrite transporter NarK
MDIAFYGNSISNPLILKSLQPHGSLLSHTLLSGGIFLFSALPGYWVAVWLLDRLGRRRIQWQGFAVMALAFAAIALIPGVTKQAWEFLGLFAVSYFFVEFGPNMTTFIYPSEIFPTAVRGSADGISAGAGKVGAFLGALLVPHLLKWVGLSGVMSVMAAVSIAGLLLTVLALPEPNGQSLEVASGEHRPATELDDFVVDVAALAQEVPVP